MKFKYFLRGLGMGIVFASIVFLSVYRNHNALVISDDEIIRRAQELGMVEKEDPLKDLLGTTRDVTEAPSSGEQEEKDQTAGEKEKQTTEKQTTEKQTTEKQSTEKQTTEKEQSTEKRETTTERDQAAGNTEQTTEKEGTAYTITIKRGDTSYPICVQLQEMGMIDDAEKFDTYLVENGYANRLRVGEHALKKGMDYRAIAEAISDPA